MMVPLDRDFIWQTTLQLYLVVVNDASDIVLSTAALAPSTLTVPLVGDIVNLSQLGLGLAELLQGLNSPHVVAMGAWNRTPPSDSASGQEET